MLDAVTLENIGWELSGSSVGSVEGRGVGEATGDWVAGLPVWALSDVGAFRVCSELGINITVSIIPAHIAVTPIKIRNVFKTSLLFFFFFEALCLLIMYSTFRDLF